MNNITKKHSGNELILGNNKTKKNQLNLYSSKGGGNKPTLGRILFGKKIENNNINYDKFDVATKEQFNQLKTDVRATRISAFFAKKLGRITDTQYKLQLRLLFANLYMAKMQLYQAKMANNNKILVNNENSIIKKMHKLIIKIIEIEKKINEGYIIKNDIKEKLKPKKILKIIKKQDKIRYALLNLITFENSNEITKGCASSGKALSFYKQKEFICILGKHRKYESKFNKYYKKFKIELEGYFAVYPNCDGAIRNINLKSLDIADIGEEHGLFIDETKCDTANLDKMQSQSFAEIAKISENQLSSKYVEKISNKQQKISEYYINSSKSLENTVNKFNERINKFKTHFKILEFYGIHRYPGLLPRKQNTLSKKTYQLVNPNKLKALSTDKVFVQQFSSMIKNIAKQGKDIFTPQDSEIIEIIPNIMIKDYKTKIANFNILIINTNNFDYKKTTLKSFFDISVFDKNTDYPIVIGINNGSNEMVNRDSSFCKVFLENLYIPISFSNHGSTNNKKYNIIFLLKNAILEQVDNPDYLSTLQPIDQSSRFTLNELPEGMILENNQKSFTSINLITSNLNNNKEGINIVCTELVGSNPTDLYYAKKIIDFKLRSKQINTILEYIDRFIGRKPDFIIGDLGGSTETIIKSSINRTSTTKLYIDNLWDYFTKKYTDFIPNFENNKDNLQPFFTDGFDLLSNNYTLDTYYTPSDDNYTKKELLTLSNYIAHLKVIKEIPPPPPPPPPPPNKFLAIPDKIDNYGGNLPIYKSYKITSVEKIKNPIPLQSRIKLKENVKLFNEKELQDILLSLDQLMSVFAYGKIPYIRRDLGCFSLQDDTIFGNKILPKLYPPKFFSGTGKKLLKYSIKDINYKDLDKVLNIPENAEGIEQLKTFYTMNLPAVLESFLFQKSGFFAETHRKDENIYYSENQIIMSTNTAGQLETMPTYGNKLDLLKQDGLVNSDIAIRMFLMPSSHVKLIMNIDIRGEITNSTQVSARDYKKLTKIALQTFYGKYAINLLEKRLSELLTNNSTNNIISHLLELTPDGNLKNLGNGDIILYLFEMIFIFLRMKFIDYQMELYDIEIKKNEEPLVDIEGKAKVSGKYKTETTDTYENISNLITLYDSPLIHLLYPDGIDRTTPLYPKLMNDDKSLIKLVKELKHKPIEEKTIEELEKAGLAGLQYYEAYLSYLLGIRLDKIANVLKSQTITNHTEYLEFFTKNLPANFDNLLNDATTLHNSIQTGNTTDIQIGDKIYNRIKIIISRLKQVNDEWVNYFEQIITLLELYYTSIQLLIIYEKTTEDTVKHDDILKIIELIKNNIFIDKPNKPAILTLLRNLPYKLTNELEIMASQIDQIYNRINSKMQTDISFEVASTFKSSIPYSKNTIISSNPVSVFNIATRSAYGMFNKINELFTASTTPRIDYQKIMNICDAIEINFAEVVRLRDNAMTHSSSTSHHKIDKNDIIYIENHEILTKMTRLIWNICDILNKGTNSYTDVNPSPSIKSKPTPIELTKVFENIISSIGKIKYNINVQEINYFMMKPINLIVNLMYYITNVFTNTNTTTTDELVIISSKTEKPLYKIYKDILNIGANESVYRALFNIRNNNYDSNNLRKELSNNIILNSKFGDIYNEYLNLLNSNKNDIRIINSIIPILETNNLIKDTIINLENTTKPKNYNEFLMDNILECQKNDETICKLIRNFQYNDDCSDNTNSKKLEYEVKYKPSIFTNYVGSYYNETITPATPPDGSTPSTGLNYYTPNTHRNKDNSMVYLFLDVLDYYKNKPTEITELLKQTKTHITNAIAITHKNPPNEPFQDVFEKMLFKQDNFTTAKNTNYVINNNFINELLKIFNLDNDDLNRYLLDGTDTPGTSPSGTSPKYNDYPTTKYNTASNTISGQETSFITSNYYDNIFDINFLAILKRLMCTKRFYEKDLNTNYYETSGNQATWEDNKQYYKFGVNYFKSNKFLTNENNYIDTYFLRDYFLKVIYQNCLLEQEPNNLDKKDKLNLIIKVIYTLSYLLNNELPDVINDTNKCMEFGFILLGVASMDKFMPSDYFHISKIIEKSTNWLDDFVNKYFKEHLSYYCKEHSNIEKLSNKIIQDYSKSLAIYKANYFANDVISDKTLYDNTYIFMEFVKTFTLPSNNDIFNDIIKINHLIKKLEILIGDSETNKGILNNYIEIVNKNINFDSSKPALHPYYIIDFLEQIKFNDVNKNINTIIPTYTDAINKLDDTIIKNYNLLYSNVAIDIIKTTLLGNQPTNIYNLDGSLLSDKVSDLTFCYPNEQVGNIINDLVQYVSQLLNIRDVFFQLFFANLFGDNNYVPELPSPSPLTNEYQSRNSPTGALYYHNKMMKHLQDCIEFVISYKIFDSSQITDANINDCSNLIRDNIMMIFNIFQNELSNTIVPVFSLSSTSNKNIKDILDNINKVINSSNKPNYEWKSYTTPPKVSSDKGIFDYIYTLLNGKDDENNYYMLSNISSKDYFEKYSKNAIDNDTQFNEFYNNIITKGYLFNSIDINLHSEEINTILTEPNKEDNVLKTIIPELKNKTVLYEYFTKNMSIPYLDYINNIFADFNFYYTNNNITLSTPSTSKELFLTRINYIVNIINELSGTKLNKITTDYTPNITNSSQNIDIIKTIYNDLNSVKQNLNSYFFIKNNIHQILYNNIFHKSNNYELTSLINNEIIENDIINILDEIIELYTTLMRKSIDFVEVQKQISKINKIFEKIISKITTAREYLKIGYGEYAYKNIDNDIYQVIRNPDYDANVVYNASQKSDTNKADQKKILIDKIKNEYKYAEALLNGLEDSVRALFNLTPCNLDNQYVDKSLNHRNNLFIVTNVLGYMNTKLTDFTIKNNTYLDNKLNMLINLPNKIINDTTEFKKIKDTMQYIMNYYNKENIFSIKNVDIVIYNIPDAKDKKIKNFIVPNNSTTIAPQKQERCIYWTYPLFNFNCGTVATDLVSLEMQPSINIVKNIIMNFIKDNYDNKILDDFLKKTITETITKNLDASVVQVIDNIITNNILNIANYKSEIVSGFNKIITFMKTFNNENKDIIRTLVDKYFDSSGTPPELTIKTSIDDFNNELGNLMNKIINNFANISNMRQLVIEFIIELFKKYIIYLNKSGNYAISLNQFNRIVNNFYSNPSIATKENYNLSAYIYKLLLILNDNKDIEDINDINNLIVSYDKIYNASLTTYQDNIKIIVNSDTIDGLSDIKSLKDYTSSDNFIDEFKFINPGYFDVLMKTYSKVLTQINSGTLEYDHNHIVNVLNENMLSLNINNIMDNILSLSGKTVPHTTLLDLVKEEIFTKNADKIIYSGKTLKFTELLKAFNDRVKQIFVEYKTKTKTSKPNFILEGGENKYIKNNKKHFTRKLGEFIIKEIKKSKQQKLLKKTKINNDKKYNVKKSMTYHTIN
jgi:hypothetical protein